MKIAIGSDHGGYDLKILIKNYLIDSGHDVVDVGCDTLDSVDYPNYGFLVGEAVANNQVDRGIVFCGSGIGISIAANKVHGVRCALVYDVLCAKLAREHNNSNVLALGGRIIGNDLAKAIVDTWLQTEYEGGRHQKRLDLISDYKVK